MLMSNLPKESGDSTPTLAEIAVNPSTVVPFDLDAEKRVFGGRDPQSVLQIVKKRQPIPDKNAAGVDITHKGVPDSYKWYHASYTKNTTCIMNEKQRDAFKTIFNKFSDTLKASIFDEIAKIGTDNVVPSSHNHNKNDKCRVIQARNEPTFLAQWTKCLMPLEHRSDLDAAKSNASDDRSDILKPFNGLAELINNHEGDWQPQNPTCKYENGKKTSTWVGVEDGDTHYLEALFQQLKDIDPNEPNRPPMSGEWVKSTFSWFTSQLTKILEKMAQEWQSEWYSSRQRGTC